MISLSGAYDSQSFWKATDIEATDNILNKPGLDCIYTDCTDISGSLYFCSDEAKTELEKRLAHIPVNALHFIDSGDYHYVSLLFLQRINRPFSLLLFDHHSASVTHVMRESFKSCSIDAYGEPLTEESLEKAKASDAVLLGAVGGNVGNSRWYQVAPNLRPEAGLLKIRKGLGLFANIRPAKLFSQLKDACPLKPEIIGDGFDIVMMRELTGGVYFGEHKTEEIDGIRKSTDIMAYDENEIKRIAVKAFEVARKRGRNVTSVDKANVLDTSRLWRAVVDEVAKDYPDVTVKHMLVDNCAMQLIMNPRQFDVILTENMFGDILSDEASMITGSIGMLSSASLGAGKLGLYEPSHGSAPDIAGKGIANPIATILSAAMLLRYSFDLDEEAKAVETAVEEVLKAGYRTIDIMSEGMTQVGTVSMGDLIAEKILG